jgi:hypothetical protein
MHKQQSICYQFTILLQYILKLNYYSRQKLQQEIQHNYCTFKSKICVSKVGCILGEFNKNIT